MRVHFSGPGQAGEIALVTNQGEDTLAVIALGGEPPSVLTTVSVGSGPLGVAIALNRDLALVTDSIRRSLGCARLDGRQTRGFEHLAGGKQSQRSCHWDKAVP